MYRYFKAKANKYDQIKEWSLDSKNSFKPYLWHIIKVNTKTREVSVHVPPSMTTNIFVGSKPTMTMSIRVYHNMFTLEGWRKNWKEVTKEYENINMEESHKA